jgi:hypothetical protein
MSAPNDPVWYISRDGQRHGPFTNDEFAGFEKAGHFRPADQVWQAGMRSWIAYSDLEAHKAASRFVDRHVAGSSAKTDDKTKTCAICLLMRRAVRTLGTGLVTALRSVSTLVRKIRVPAGLPATVTEPTRTPIDAASATARASPDLSPASVRPSLFAAKESNVRRLSIAPVLEPRDVVIDPEIKQDPESASPDETIENVAEPRPPVSPRLLSEAQAAAQIGLELAIFRSWVADGRLPRALPDCGKYDMKAIDLALDRLSGIAPRESGSGDLLGRLARRKT